MDKLEILGGKDVVPMLVNNETVAAFALGGGAVRALWARITKNTDWSTGPLARPFTCSLAPLTRSLAPLTRSLAPLTHLLAPHYSFCSCAPLRSLARSLAHFPHSWDSD